MVKAPKRLKHDLKKVIVKTGFKSYHSGIFRGSLHEKRYRDLQLSEQLSVDGAPKEAVEVFAMREAQEVEAMTFRNWHGVQQQVHQLLTLQRINRQQV